jgi:hypothetical protein
MGLAVRSKLMCVQPDLIDQVWPSVADLIDSAYREMDLFTPDVLAWLKAGKGLLWIASDGSRIIAAMTSSLEPRPSGLSCRLVAAGGWDLLLWVEHMEALKRYAKAEGCVKMWFQGRQGWARVLTGYVTKAVILEMRL